MRFFTPKEADAALEVVRPLVERLVRLRRELVRAGGELGAVRSTVAGNGGRLDPERVGQLEKTAERAAAELAGVVEELDGFGVQVKDLDRGLIDFPARHPASGETVLLCWELGEASVEHWHGLEDGYAGRKPLPF
ncbi:MAG TPA: DUF2203 domain-containing protein [Gaiellaceae bacterium]|nr:DUF2203 domain-containing protein [Gaiellaceae bacterium]